MALFPARSVQHAKANHSTHTINHEKSNVRSFVYFAAKPVGLTGRTGALFDGLVVMARGKTPDPIPNSAVKTLSADGTAS